MEEFTYFVINGDPFSGGNLTVTGSGTATFLDINGDDEFYPDPTESQTQITIDTPAPGTNLTSSAWPGYGPTGAGVEIYTATIGGNPVTFAYISSSGDGVDDNVDRIAIISGEVNVSDTISGSSLDAPESQLPLEFNTVVCFALGTLIDTPNGPVAVETLRPGDLVTTRDHGPRPLIWVGQQTLSAEQLSRAPQLQPHVIPAGSMGLNTPAQDLVVSPQHRILVSTAAMQMNLGIEEALVAAKHLRSSRRLRGQGVTYVHLMFEDHEIVNSNGLWSESLFVGPEAQRSAQADEFMAIFGERPSVASISSDVPAMTLSLPALKAWEVELT